MSEKPVFFDATGRRHSKLKRLGAGIALIIAVLATLFVLSLLAIPFLSPAKNLTLKSVVRWVPALPHRLTTAESIELSHTRNEQWRNAQQPKVKIPAEKRIVAAFYAPWQSAGLSSLRSNAAHINHLMPEWLLLNETGNGLDLTAYDPRHTPANLKVSLIARRNNIALCPILSNAHNTIFDPTRVQLLLDSPVAQRQLIAQTCDWLIQNNCAGLNLDFERLTPRQYVQMVPFVTSFAKELHARHLTFSMDLEASLGISDLRELSAPCDFVVLMAYDQHYAMGTPGAIAGYDWVSEQMQRAETVIPRSKLVMGIGNYSYDWTVDSKRPAEVLTYQEAVSLAKEAAGDESPRKIINFDAKSLNATYEYQDEKGKNHQVWILDGASAYNQWLLAQQSDLRGSALWVLGSEDPSLWNFFRRNNKPEPRQALSEVTFPYEIAFQGKGEILHVSSQARTGKRYLEFDEKSGLCTDEEYLLFPSPLTVQRSGYSPNNLALTFDDGPDPEWTPQILDVLKQYNIKASFFLVGENADKYPSLVRRIFDEGHDLGNHTFTHPNIGLVSSRRARLEINATQRSIEAITGHSTRLFRPPYNADAEPQTEQEILPVELATQMGYLIVGEYIDPEDWNPVNTAPNGTTMPRTTQNIIRDVLAGAKRGQGNIILLHDAGGDRSRTVEALEVIIPRLQKMGFHFVPVSQLVGGRNIAMPPASPREKMLIAFDSAMFSIIFGLQWILALGFLIAIGLGIARMVMVLPLALIARRQENAMLFDDNYQPTVSVLIAAYNEEKTIQRTIQSVLSSTYPLLEIIVVDDGSKDGTHKVLLDAFAHEPRVVICSQDNGGKAAALNHALQIAKGEIYVGFDADTQVAPDAIGLLVRHFQDETVAAAAGNVKVGNRHNVLTRWQAIEYIASQNLDRRAYGLLNAITVVPGAIGAWRTEAVRHEGGYLTDTLAEDMDLTWRLRRAEWKIVNEDSAKAFTEAPDTLRGLFNQRFRWAYGTLQSLAKHRRALGRNGAFGKLMLPLVWIFQFVLQWLAPLVDLQLIVAIMSTFASWYFNGMSHGQWVPDPATLQFLQKTGYFYALFFAAELAGAFCAIKMDKEDMSLLWWLFWQRVVYRQLLYCVIWKSTWMALAGLRQGWNKLSRKGNVQMPPSIP